MTEISYKYKEPENIEEKAEMTELTKTCLEFKEEILLKEKGIIITIIEASTTSTTLQEEEET